jgi:hypothetical protein
MNLLVRKRRSVILVAFALGVLLLINGSCGTLVQVVDKAGVPVPDASIHPVWLSVTGAVSRTEADGYARLHDGWSLLGDPEWVFINAGGRHWEISYPPPKIIRLDPAEALPLHLWAGHLRAVGDDPQATGR